MAEPRRPSSDRGLTVKLPRYRTGDVDLDERIAAFIESLGEIDDTDLVFEMIVAAVGLARDRADRGDIKIANAALKELRRAFQVFAPYRTVRKASIFGSARTAKDDPLYRQTVEVARAIAERDWMVITGAGPGIMEAGVTGAGPENSFGAGIRLPFETTSEFLDNDPKLIVFRYFFTRKVTFLKESDGFVVMPGGFGTLDEAFELLTLTQTGKAQPSPIVLLDVPGGTYWQRWLHFVRDELFERHYISSYDESLFLVTDDTAAAVRELDGFYTNYHSQRYVDGALVIRMQRTPDAQQLSDLNATFADIVARGEIEVVGPSKAEIADADVVDLARIRFRFNRHGFARLRQLINELNTW
jgi:uncharacterized protein (TIGR00730 family)